MLIIFNIKWYTSFNGCFKTVPYVPPLRSIPRCSGVLLRLVIRPLLSRTSLAPDNQRSFSFTAPRTECYPANLLEAEEDGARVIRQSSNPESACEVSSPLPTPSPAGRRKSFIPGVGRDRLASVVTESIKLNGAIHQMKEVSPSHLVRSQVRNTGLLR